MDQVDREILEKIQDGIPIVEKPFSEIGESLGLDESEVIDRLNRLIDEGKVRRFAASIAHIKVGINANAMCVWDVPDERVEEVGSICASFPEVTHCYERPRLDDWHYNLFTMVHGKSRKECEEVIQRISERINIDTFIILFSDKEYKKTGVRL
ncbi:Lrp/AsnC family transcriptional regulator [Methanosarcinales archaeon]|uniref:siroheme decarboxylase n=1 Tax=Candidatus Syntropharchaeum caldarium TaxID=1838285 RepID=A0A1F2P8Q1_9EURY|nr:MAG: transcriptional regulator, AsnC family [Candidatus Syntrophoarchaeum caldarius]RLG32345.1 MAG: Lrp/AsnC family transcriptional regulator [Methanosarcinales archaeon]